MFMTVVTEELTSLWICIEYFHAFRRYDFTSFLFSSVNMGITFSKYFIFG